MDAKLRKRHKIIWAVLAPFVMLMLIWSAKGLDFSQTNEPVTTKTASSEVVAKAENGQISVVLLKKPEGNSLEIVVKTPLRAPSAVVFALKGTSKSESLLGQLEGVGSYKFQVSGDVRGIHVQDVIKKQSVLKLEF